MKAVYALFTDHSAVQRAFERLRAAGVDDETITIISAEPIEHFEFSERHRKSPLFWIASGGGGIGLLSAILLTTYAQRAWPIVTGGMPIVAWWANLIILFEMTMLGAILATVLALLVMAGLPDRRPLLYDTQVMDGKILVGAANQSQATLEKVERVLAAEPGAQIKTIA